MVKKGNSEAIGPGLKSCVILDELFNPLYFSFLISKRKLRIRLTSKYYLILKLNKTKYENLLQ